MNTPAVIAALLFGALPFMAAAAADAPLTDKNPQLICKGGQKVIGSRMRTPRRCRTAEQWRAEEEKASRLPETLRVGAPKDEGAPRPH
jgi:hypothetical protein